MANKDVLYYDIAFRTDEQSLKAALARVTQAQEKVQEEGEGFQLKVGVGEAVQDLQKVNEALKAGQPTLVELQDQIDSYRGQIKALAAQQKEQGELTDAQKEQQQALKIALKATTNDYNQQLRSLSSLKGATGETARTYDELVKQNKAISAELRRLPLNDTTGRLKQLQQQYKQNNQALKDFDAEMGNHQRNVGDYRGALQDAISSMGNFEGDVGGVVKGAGAIGGAFKGAGQAFSAAGGGVRGFSAALKASGIGLFLPLAGALITAVTKIQPVMDAAERVTSAFSVALATAGDGIVKLVDVGRRFFSGQMTLNEALQEGKQVLSDTGQAISDNVSANDKYIVQLQKIEEQEIALITARAQANAQLAQARLDAKDEALTFQEREDALRRAIELEEEIANREMEIAAERARVLNEQLDLTTSSREEIRLAAEATARVADLEVQSINRRREAEENLRTLRREAAAEHQQQLIATAALRESLAQATQQATRITLTTQQEVQDTLQQGFNQVLENARVEGAGRIEIEEDVGAARLQTAKTVGDQLLSIGAQVFEKNKALAVSKAVIDTLGGANAAFRDTPGNIVIRLLAAASALAAGYANVKKILATKPGGGGGGTSAAAARPNVPGVTTAGMATFQAGGGAAGAGMNEAATTTAALTSFANRGRPMITVDARVDRRGLAIAVREGEQEIRTEQITYT